MGTGAAFFVGMIGAFVYIGSAKLLLMLKIDDPLEACPLHARPAHKHLHTKTI